MNAGVKLMLPVYEPGALLFLGDGHARQGEGEVVGTGLETSMDVEFTVDLVKKKSDRLAAAREPTRTSWCSAARGRCSKRFSIATAELQRWLHGGLRDDRARRADVHGTGDGIRGRQRRRSELHRRRQDSQGSSAAAMIVNGRTYRRPTRPTVVVCLDGSAFE